MRIIDKLLGIREQATASLVPELALERRRDGTVVQVGMDDLFIGIEAKGVSVKTAAKRPTDFKQADRRWKKKVYSATGNKSQTMASSGCGPTAMADILYTFGVGISPWGVAKKFMAAGHRTKNDGTAWAAFKWSFNHFKDVFAKYAQTKDFGLAGKALAAGALIVCSMGPGFWTRGGHFICVWRAQNGKVYACDPASRVRKHQKVKPFKAQCKAMFIFWPK